MYSNASIDSFSTTSGYTSPTSLCSSPVSTVRSSPVSTARSSPVSTARSSPAFPFPPNVQANDFFGQNRGSPIQQQVCPPSFFPPNVQYVQGPPPSGQMYYQLPYQPATFNHYPDAHQRFYPSPAPTTYGVDVEHLKSQFLQRENTFRATIDALLKKVISQQETIKQNLACFTEAMKEQMQFRSKVEQALQLSTQAFFKCGKVASETQLERLSDLNVCSDRYYGLLKRLGCQQDALTQLRKEKRQTDDRLRDQLKYLSDRVASLEANVAPTQKVTNDAGDRIDSKVDSQPKADEYVMNTHFIPARPEVIQCTDTDADRTPLDVQRQWANFSRRQCGTHAWGSEHLPGPCDACKTRPLITDVQGHVT